MGRVLLAAAAVALAVGSACAGGGLDSGFAECPLLPADRYRRLAMPSGVPAGDALRGTALFETQCERCHSRDVALRGSRMFRSYPRLDCREWLGEVSDGYLYTAIAEGGPAVGKREVMSAFEEALDAQEISDLVAYLRELQWR